MLKDKKKENDRTYTRSINASKIIKNIQSIYFDIANILEWIYYLNSILVIFQSKYLKAAFFKNLLKQNESTSQFLSAPGVQPIFNNFKLFLLTFLIVFFLIILDLFCILCLIYKDLNCAFKFAKHNNFVVQEKICCIFYLLRQLHKKTT